MDKKITNASITYSTKDDAQFTITAEEASKTGKLQYEISADYVKFNSLEEIIELVEDFKSRLEE